MKVVPPAPWKCRRFYKALKTLGNMPETEKEFRFSFALYYYTFYGNE